MYVKLLTAAGLDVTCHCRIRWYSACYSRTFILIKTEKWVVQVARKGSFDYRNNTLLTAR